MRALLAAGLLAFAGCTTSPPVAGPEPPAPAPPNPFDPRQVDDLPEAPADIARGLPAVIDPPASAPRLADRPVPAAVLSAYAGNAVVLLTSDGSWRRVPAPRRSFGGTELTRDGRRLAVETPTGVDVWDLPTGERTRVAVPEQARPWDYSSWRWIDHDTALLDDEAGGWRVDVASGEAESTAYPSSMSFWWTVDPDGAVVESADWRYPNRLTDWATGQPRRVGMRSTGRLMSLRADRRVVVGTSYDDHPFGVYVADRTDLAPLHVLRVRDHDANYSNGGLTVLALLGDGTVLLRVAVLGDGPGIPWRIVAWEPDSGRLSVVSRVAGSVESESVATDAAGRSGLQSPMAFDVAASAYGRFMGRYSEPLADRLVELTGVRAGQRAVDVGCGPGVLTTRLAERLGAENVAAVDPSPPFVAAARERCPGVDVRQGRAEDLPYADGSVDAAMANLVVHFMSDPVQGLREMGRVVAADGVVAATVWNHATANGPLSTFWQAAKDLDPDVADEAALPGTGEGDLGGLAREAGLRDVVEGTITVTVPYSSFEEWWEPYTLGVGPAGDHVRQLDDARRTALREHCRELLPAGPFTVEATAWSVLARPPA